jgi:hypothetical protein
MARSAVFCSSIGVRPIPPGEEFWVPPVGHPVYIVS